MAIRHVESILRHLRRLAGGGTAAEQTDRYLLELFVAQRDEAAFEALAARHGPMVWGVCRKLLRDLHDAEDAFQAVFLVLVRRASAIPWRESIGGWLHGVAVRTALEARARVARRFSVKPLVEEIVDPRDPMSDVLDQEEQRLIHEEIQRLPTKYRSCLVLCFVEGKTHEEAAQEIGVPRGSMAKLLANALERLRKRLTARGMTLPAGLLATFLAEGVTEAVPAGLTKAAIKGALLFTAGQGAASGISAEVLSLTEGVLRAMFMTRMKTIAGALLVIAVIGTGSGLATHQVLAQRGDRSKEVAQKAGDPAGPSEKRHDRSAPQTDEQRIQQLIDDLESNTFATREKAARELEQLGQAAVKPLEDSLKKNPGLESRQRLEQLLMKLTTIAIVVRGRCQDYGQPSAAFRSKEEFEYCHSAGVQKEICRALELKTIDFDKHMLICVMPPEPSGFVTKGGIRWQKYAWAEIISLENRDGKIRVFWKQVETDPTDQGGGGGFPALNVPLAVLGHPMELVLTEKKSGAVEFVRKE